MKKCILFLFVIAFLGNISAQEMPKDVEKVYRAAVKLTSKKEYDKAIGAYKEVLRSVPNHYKSLESIGDIHMNLKAKPNYRAAYEHYQKAVDVLNSCITSTHRKKVKNRCKKEKERIIPKLNKAGSYVKDFDDAKQNREKGKRLMDDEDLN